MKPTTLFAKLLLMGFALTSLAGYAQTTPAHATPAHATTALNDPTAALNAPNVKAVKGWYYAWLNKDWNSLTQVLADGFTFSSPLDDHINTKAVKERCWSNAYKIKRVDVEQVIVNGDKAMVIGTGWTTEGKSFRNCDYFKLQNGKIITYECFFGPGVNFPNSGK